MIRKKIVSALMMATAITGGFSFSSCSSSDDVAEVNPTYNPDTKEVTADLVINISTGSNSTTRQSARNTQAIISADSPFRGIEKTTLLAFSTGAANDGKHLSTQTSLEGKSYDLGVVLSQGSLDPNGDGTTAPESHRVVELSLPTGTNNLLFYGKAIKNGTDEQQGCVEFNVSETPANTSVKLVPRIQDKDLTKLAQVEDIIKTIMTRVAQNGLVGVNKVRVDFGTDTWNEELYWYQMAENDGKSPVTPTKDLSPLEEILASAYTTFTTIKTGEIRAGSGASIARQIGDLWAVINTVRNASPTNIEEAVAIAMAERLNTRFSNYFTEEGPNCKWLTTGTVISRLVQYDTTKSEEDFNLLTDGDLQNFPENFNVPMGAAQLLFDGTTHTYSYNSSDLPLTGMGGGSTSIYSYTYPAELCYFGNSPIRVSNEPHTPTDYPDGVTAWDKDASWDAAVWTDNGHVESTTRSVAMKENVNYGTALLRTTVRYGAALLKDNNSGIHTGEDDNAISAVAGMFELTGVVVGGQNNEMGWNYLRKDEANGLFSYMIFDKDIPNGTIPAYIDGEASQTQPNYTMVFDNWNSFNKGGKQDDVYIALELKNNSGLDFWGEHNLVRNGGTFYIIGKLDPDADRSTTDRSEGINWPTKHMVPPLDDDGNTIKERRVFIQDFVTKADFVIGSESLKHAYVTVPDLRATQISFGLSVDLNWQDGLVFDEVTLGNN